MAGPTGGGGQVGNIVVRVTGDSKQFQQSMQQAKRSMQETGDAAKEEAKKIEEAARKAKEAAKKKAEAQKKAGDAMIGAFAFGVKEFSQILGAAAVESFGLNRALEENARLMEKSAAQYSRGTLVLIDRAKAVDDVSKSYEMLEKQLISEEKDRVTKNQQINEQLKKTQDLGKNIARAWGMRVGGLLLGSDTVQPLIEFEKNELKNLESQKKSLDERIQQLRDAKEEISKQRAAVGKSLIDGLNQETVALEKGAEAAKLFQAMQQNVYMTDLLRATAIAAKNKKLKEEKEAQEKLLKVVEKVDAAMFNSAEARSRIEQHNIAIRQGRGNRHEEELPPLQPLAQLPPDMHPWGRLPVPHTDAARALEGAGLAENVLRAILAVLVERLPRDQTPVLPANFGGVNGN